MSNRRRVDMRAPIKVRPRKSREKPQTYRPVKVAFVCEQCKEPIGDPLYTGPHGHAPDNICFTCWVNAFEQPPKDWPKDITVLWMISQGYSRAEALKETRLTYKQFRLMVNWRKKKFSESRKNWARRWTHFSFSSSREGHHVH